MRRYCPNCGTEVDETALFCPTCGSPIDEEMETQLPPAPAWPEPDEEPAAVVPPPAPPQATPVEHEPHERVEPAFGSTAPSRWERPEPVYERPASSTAPEPEPEEEPWVEEPTRAEERPSVAAAPPPVQPSPRRAGAPPARGGTMDRPSVDVPFTMPVMLSGWLIGGGALLAAIGLVIGFFTHALIAIDLVLVLALLGVAATVFLASVPEIPHLRLAILAVVLVGLGMGLDRLLIRAAGVDVLLLFLGTAAAVIGAILVEVGKDAPVGSPRP